MTRTSTILLALLAGFVGALAATTISPARASETTPVLAEVRAQRFVVVDAAGRTRAVLASPDAGPGLLLLDAAGKLRAMLSVGAAGSLLRLYDTAGSLRVGLAVTVFGQTTRGTPALHLLDAAGKTRVALVAHNDDPGVVVLDAAGNACDSMVCP